MFLAANLRKVTDGDIEVISYKYIFKKRLSTTDDKRVLKFDLQIICATFDFAMCIAPTEEIRVFAIELQSNFAENNREL